MTSKNSVRSLSFFIIVPLLLTAGVLSPRAAEARHRDTYNHDTQPSCWINANPSHIYGTNGTELTWGSTHAESASLSDYGNVSLQGSKGVYPTSDRDYTLTVYGAHGDSATCSVHVVRDDISQERPTCSVSLSYPYYDGSSSNRPATLTWSSSGTVNSTYINGIGSVSSSGSQTVYPSSNETYTMTVSGPYGSNTCQVTSRYSSADEPTCTLKNSPDIVIQGGSAVLRWTTTGNIRSAFLSDSGSVSTNGGTMVVYPGSSRTYTLTVQDYAGTTRSCSTYIAVSGSGNVISPTYYPTYPSTLPSVTPTTYITLKALPYTGLELGVTGTILYYLALASVLVAFGYGMYTVFRKVMVRA